MIKYNIKILNNNYSLFGFIYYLEEYHYTCSLIYIRSKSMNSI